MVVYILIKIANLVYLESIFHFLLLHMSNVYLTDTLINSVLF